jgi:predicted ATPase
MIHRLAISGYRSLRDIVIELGQLTVITGPNGSGKSSLYRALRLLADLANGRIIASLAAEGGLSSTLWAGPESFGRAVKSGEYPVEGTVRSKPIALKLGFASDDYGYAVDLGMPSPSRTRFALDPEIKVEALWVGQELRPSNLIAERRNGFSRVRNRDGAGWTDFTDPLGTVDSMLTQRADTRDGYELLVLRERIRQWRFYDELRTDRASPARQAQIGTFTPVLSGDGSDLGAAIQTIIEIGESALLAETIADAFDGASIDVGERFEIEMRQYGLLRALSTTELSDGTLRYILLAAALLSPRPPELIILNEPEASLHPDLLAPLARLIRAAARRCQLIVVTHAGVLVDGLYEDPACGRLMLAKELGETIVTGGLRPGWTWPKR